jgi:Uma2 family endonuclease
MSATPATLVSLDDYLAMPDRERYEWVDGRLVERAVSWATSWLAARLIARIGPYVESRELGYVAAPDNGLVLNPDRPRSYRYADVSFTRADRAPGGPSLRGHQTIPPDLAVEVVSPGDEAHELDLKIQEYLDAGVRLIWVVYPVTRTVDVIRPSGQNSRLREGDTLDGEDVLPGFTLPVAEVFAGMPAG